MPRLTSPRTGSPTRTARALSRERILAEAIELADRDGIDALSMRKLAQRLSVDPMSLYNHVRDKDDLLDGIADAVVSEIELVSDGSEWRTALRATIMRARDVMLRHPWAASVIESRRTPGPATLRYMDTVMGIIRTGFSVAMTHHAIHLLGSRVLGFSQDLFDDKSDAGDVRPDPAAAAAMGRAMAESHPHVAEMALAVSHEGGLGGCDDDIEFAFGLDLILEGLDRRRDLGGGGNARI